MGESQVMQEPLERLRRSAADCRELAGTALTTNAREVLSRLAEDYDKKAAELERLERRRAARPPFKWSVS